jgi:hypothetical protein
MEVVKAMITGSPVRKNAKKSVWNHQAEVSYMLIFQELSS